MTVFSAARKAVLRSDGTVITEVYSSAEQIGREMADLANEAARDIALSHDWRDMTRIHTFVGDGIETAFPKPADYDRMVVASSMSDPAMWLWGYCAIPTVNEWMRLVDSGFHLVTPGGWILLGGEFQFYPAPDGSASFPYISRNFARSESGTEKAEFTSDDDEFVLDERLLTLALVWRWKAQKGMDYSEDMASYELALSQAQARDKGARVIERNTRSNISGARVGWPWSLG